MAQSPNTPRATQTRQNRAHVLATARKLFTAHPYEDVTMRVIAKAAGCSTGGVFSHWPEGKDALFAEAMGRRPITDAMGAALLALATHHDPEGAAAVMATAFVGQRG